MFTLLKTLIESTQEQFIPYLGELVFQIWRTLKSPLAFSYVKDLYIQLVPIIFMNDKNTFGKIDRQCSIILDFVFVQVMRLQI